ncbi:MAG TPA: hypothetical protein VGC00_10285 [Thermoanaerobaculia bacterium]|jgi:ElaB/YqjD/DUF883 family membrane-anchored ribosome-binding protein
MNEKIERTKEGMSSLIDRTRDAVVGVSESAERRVETAAGRAVERTHAAGERVRAGADTASSGAHRSLESAAQALDAGMARARNDLSRAATATTDYVTANPGKAVLIAASAGFVLGVLARGRRPSA